MATQPNAQSDIKGPTITFPKRFYDLATALPKVKERHDFILNLLAAMFDTDVEDWLRDERVNRLLATACERLRMKYPKYFPPMEKRI